MTSEAPSPELARRVGLLVAAAAVALTVFAAAKHFAMGGLSDAETTAGEAAIARMIAGDEKAAVDARSAFADAASVSPFDYYPAFGIASVKRMETLRAGRAEARTGDAVLLAMLARDWTAARAAVDEMRGSEPERAEYYDRLVEAVIRQSSTNSE